MKYFGNIGFAVTQVTEPGIWEQKVVERPYFGEVVRNSRRWETGDKVNDDLRVNNQLSIVADGFCHAHTSCMKYATWMGAKWKIESVDISYPRLVLTLGGVWNGAEPETGPDETPGDSGGDSGDA